MTADCLDQSVCRMRHMAVVAATPTGTDIVVRVRRNIVRDLGMALKTSVIAEHVALQLINGVAVVHAVTRDARKVASLKTWRFDKAVVLAPRNTDHTV